MIRPPPLPATTERALGNARRSVLIVLGACGLGVLAMTSGPPRPLSSATDSWVTTLVITTLVIVLALGAIAARQVAARAGKPRTRARCLLAAYSFAAGLGIAGLLLALATGEGLRAMGSVLAGAIFALPGSRSDGAAAKRGSR